MKKLGLIFILIITAAGLAAQDNSTDPAELLATYKALVAQYKDAVVQAEDLLEQYKSSNAEYQELVKELQEKTELLNQQINTWQEISANQDDLVAIYKEGYDHYSSKWENIFNQYKFGITLSAIGGAAVGVFAGYLIFTLGNK